MKILMVCLGNICRSPLAEGILASKAKEQNLPWVVDSAGTGAYHIGKRPDPRSRTVAKRHGFSIGYQHARQFSETDFADFDVIFAMDRSNQENILRLATAEEDREKVHLILDYSSNEEGVVEVPDPYWNNDGFEYVYQLLDAACDKVIKKLTAPTRAV